MSPREALALRGAGLIDELPSDHGPRGGDPRGSRGSP